MEKYKSITLYKYVISDSNVSRTDKVIGPEAKWYDCRRKTIGSYFTLKEAETALTAQPIECNVVGYSIEGPEYGRKIDHEEFDPTFEKEYPDEYYEGDESPEFSKLYLADKQEFYHYEFGGHKPGQIHYLEDANPLKEGDLVWIVEWGSKYDEDSLSAMYPAVVVKKLDEAFVAELCERVNREIMRIFGEDYPQISLKGRIGRMTDIEWDSYVVRPQVIVANQNGFIHMAEDEYIPRV